MMDFKAPSTTELISLGRSLQLKQIPTISLTGSYLPGDLIFTYGLHAMSVLLFMVVTAMYHHYDKKVSTGLFAPVLD